MKIPQKLLVIKADTTVEVIDRASKKKEYEQFVELVGGYIEPVIVATPMRHGRLYRRNAYVNEEGIIKRLPVNSAATAIYRHSAIHGTMVVMLNKGDEPDVAGIRQLY